MFYITLMSHAYFTYVKYEYYIENANFFFFKKKSTHISISLFSAFVAISVVFLFC